MQFHERERERETATVLIIISENELFACRIPDQQQKQKSIRPRIHFFHPHLFSSFPFLPFPSLPFSLLSFPSIHSFLFEIRPFPPRRGIVENVSLRLVSISRLRCSDVTRGVARYKVEDAKSFRFVFPLHRDSSDTACYCTCRFRSRSPRVYRVT